MNKSKPGMNANVVEAETGPEEGRSASPPVRLRHSWRDISGWRRIIPRAISSFLSGDPNTPSSDQRTPPRARARARPLALIILGNILLCTIIAVTTGLLVMHLRDAALVEAEKEFERLSLILADQAERAFEAVDLSQAGLLDRAKNSGMKTPEDFRRVMSGTAMHEEMRTRTQALPQLEALAAIDTNGKLINFSRYWPTPDIDLTDRDYYKALSQHPEQTTYIGQPVPNRGTGTWTMYLVRKVSGPQGDFLGLTTGAVQLSYFEQLYQAAAPDSQMAVSLFRNDGTLLARYPKDDPQIGRLFTAGSVFARLKETASGHLITRQASLIDGVEKLIAARSLMRLPMVVTVSAPVSSILSHWRRQESYLIGAAALLEVLMIIAGLLMVRQLRSQQLLHDARAARAEAAQHAAEAGLALANERERVTWKLHLQNLRFEAALGNMTQALGMFDASDTLIVVNRRLADMFGLPPESMQPGMTIQTLLGAVAANSNLQPSDLESMQASFQQFKADPRPASRLRELADGRTLAVNFVPIDGDGWLVTFEDITERRQAESKISYMAHHDALTGLPNRVLFRERLSEALARSRRGEPCAVLYLDLDNFNSVNDTLGHPVGDALLREVTKRLNAQIREVDTVARLGGDEFAIVQSSVDQPRDATALAARLIELLAAPYDVDGHRIIIGASIGIAVVPGDGDNPDQLLKNAHMALYGAKADGRGRHRFFEPAMDAAMQDRRTLELDLRKALVEGEFRVFYQPLMHLRTQSLTGFEALVRWHHPEKGMVSPSDFIPLAEEIGLIIPLGKWVLRQACADAVNWPGNPKVAVNLSPVQLGSKTLVQDVASALAQTGLDPARLELEITETAMLEDTDAILVILHQLRDLGVGIAMDDFGTGYSSLSYLRRFPFSKVKIDRSFIEGMGQGGDCHTIIAAIADLCKQLGIVTTAEGVETDDQLARLSAGNCTEAQGYLFSKPWPAHEVAGMCARLSQPARISAGAW